ncbi:MAG TPA: nucleotidyltransferase family protein [Steroidobacteraceae bacterium]|jgi:hypothetical protein
MRGTLAAVDKALRKVTETLAQELVHSTTVAPDWSPFEWDVARAAASIHGVSALLCTRLRWQGPPKWAQFLADQSRQTLLRHARFMELLASIDAEAKRAGLPLLALKGAALHAAGLYVPGERPMADVDLLIPESGREAVHRLMSELRFELAEVSWRHESFEPEDRTTTTALGESAANPLKIELHWRIREKLPQRLVDVSEQIFWKQPQPGLNYYSSKAAAMTHLLLHAGGAIASKSIRLVHLQDIARLSATMAESDWLEIVTPPAPLSTPWWAFPAVILTARYFGGIPDTVMQRLRSACPVVLRRLSEQRALSDVSLSHLWVSVFPGIEWATSLTEAAHFAAVRIFPDREAAQQRRNTVRSQADVTETGWMRLSQPRRILLWLRAPLRMPRPPTLAAVRAALGEPSR